MNLTAQNEIKYTLFVPNAAELYALATSQGYVGRKIKSQMISFLHSLGFDCVHWSTEHNIMVLGKF